MEKSIFQVLRLEARSNDYHMGESYLENEHLGYFSTVEKAMSFIDSRVSKNYGSYFEYCICRIILDDMNVKSLWIEDNRKKQLDEFDKIKAGDSNG